MLWIDCTPHDLTRLADESGVCVIPIGSLERHGLHCPLGCDGVICETIAARAAEITPCVVFPTWYWGNAHAAACFGGTVNFSPELQISLMREMCAQISANGFKKIVFFNGHGSNTSMMRFFDTSTMDDPARDYCLYFVDSAHLTGQALEERDALLSTVYLGHGDEWETALYMGCRPGATHLEYCSKSAEPILPRGKLNALTERGVYSGLAWYGDFPENVTGVPSAATEEVGRKLVELHARYHAETLRLIQEDSVTPALLREFRERQGCVGKSSKSI